MNKCGSRCICLGAGILIGVAIPEEYLLELIVVTLKKMNDGKALEERHIGIYERFVEKPKKKKKKE